MTIHQLEGAQTSTGQHHMASQMLPKGQGVSLVNHQERYFVLAQSIARGLDEMQLSVQLPIQYQLLMASGLGS